jgi:hypothetical protein
MNDETEALVRYLCLPVGKNQAAACLEDAGPPVQGREVVRGGSAGNGSQDKGCL